ncbi:MAG: SPFH domain-containing protein [Proteobacteria bacterium]|nr:SPFH domain-containing protein [Pseudomonadota bacterium]
MLGIKFIKSNPTTHLIAFRGGKIVRQGAGMALLYYAPTTSLVAVPIESREVPFIFEKVTSDFQTVTIQGQLSFRIADPERTARSLNFTLSADGTAYQSKDPEKLRERVVAIAQVAIQRYIHGSPLTEAIRSSGAIAAKVLGELRQSGELAALGAELQGLSILAIKPTPETARALEAKAREAILLEADSAIYARRNAAVENERAIKQSELDTEVAVEQKKRTIRETQMDAEASVQQRKAQLREADLTANILLEEQRKQLVAASADNARTSAEAEAYRIEASVRALKSADPRLIQALASVGMEPRQLIAQAFGGLAERAERIGQLNLSPDLLQTLLAAPGRTEVSRGK